jgi:CubicO group peptidase (beta-lactamase class C family)
MISINLGKKKTNFIFAKTVKKLMRNFIIILISLIVSISCNNPLSITQKQHKEEFKYRKLSKSEKKIYQTKSEILYHQLLERTGFNGGILIAKNGEIIFEKYNGFSNFKSKEPITSITPFHIASVSKTFTAMAILRLWEQGKLNISDSLQQFFPSMPYHNITIQDLLSHRSGLPNYVYFSDTAFKKNSRVTNQDVLNFMVNAKPELYAKPNKFFHYCNTNYILLALIIEKTTGMSYPNYMKDSIFNPIGMKNSFVFSIKDTNNYNPSYGYNNQPYNLENIDCIYGDKNIYSTVQDLFSWDKALYNNSIVSYATYRKAIIPYSNERITHHNYGLGWRLLMSNDDTTVYHNGWWHGNNSVFVRLLKDTATIITLGNKYNRSIYSTAKMSNLFSTPKNEEDLEE